MKKTRLQDALGDASKVHTDKSSIPSTQGSVNSRQFDQLADRSAAPALAARRPSLRRAQPACNQVVALSAGQEVLAHAAVQVQLTALEQRFDQLDNPASTQQLVRAAAASTTETWLKHESASVWYAIGNVVGEGTFGRVQLAQHRISNAHVAVKSYFREKGALVCSPPPSSSGKQVRLSTPKTTSETEPLEWKRVRQEVKLMASLQPHPGVSQFIEAFETPTLIQVVVEFTGNGSLCDLLKKSPQQRLPEAKAKRLFAQLCSAVQSLHRQNVIHRDLKLENVLLDDELSPKIIDFGFSQVEYSSSRYPDTPDGAARSQTARSGGVKNFCGTPSYMAPEVVSCKSYDGQLVDVWSLGVILYLLLCGKFPFQASNLHQLYQAIRTTPLSFPASVSKDAQQLLHGILVVDPQRRLSLALIQAHPWMQQRPHKTPARDQREHAFESFMEWQRGSSLVCEKLERLYGPVAVDLTAALQDQRTRQNSVVAMVRLSLLEAQKHFYLSLSTGATPTVATKDELLKPGKLMAALTPAGLSKPPRRLSLPESAEPRTHKQQLEQLIGLVKQSLDP